MFFEPAFGQAVNGPTPLSLTIDGPPNRSDGLRVLRLDQWNQLMPNPISSVTRIEIRGILSPRDPLGDQCGANQIASRVQQRADEHEVVGDRSGAPDP
jgi:hypothetical protein